MNNNKNEILKNICYTELVYGRINKKLNIGGKLPQKQFDFKVDKMFNFKLVTDEKGTDSKTERATFP